jgi:hypothetical protein
MAECPSTRQRNANVMATTGSTQPLSGLTPYELKNLVSHLLESDRLKDIGRLIQLTDGASRNAFFAARLDRGEASGYFDDLRKSQRRSHLEAGEQLASESGAAAIASEVAFSLSLNLAHSELSWLKPSLLGMAVERRVWSVDHALVVARSARGLERALQAYSSLAPSAAKNGRPDVVDEALAVISERRRFRSHWITATRDEELDDLQPETKDGSFEHPIEYEKMRAIRQCARILSPDQFRTAVDAASSIRPAGYRIEALGALVKCAGEATGELYRDILKHSREGEEFSLALALADAIPHLNRKERRDAERRGWRAEEDAWKSYSIQAWMNGKRDGRLIIRTPVSWIVERFELLYRLCVISADSLMGRLEKLPKDADVVRQTFIEAASTPAFAQRGLEKEAVETLKRIKHPYLSILAIEKLILLNHERPDKSSLVEQCHERLRHLERIDDPSALGLAMATVATFEEGEAKFHLRDRALTLLSKMTGSEVKVSVILKVLQACSVQSCDLPPEQMTRVLAAIEELKEPNDDEFFRSAGDWLPQATLERGLAIGTRQSGSDITASLANAFQSAGNRFVKRAREKTSTGGVSRNRLLTPDVGRSLLSLFESQMNPPSESAPELSDYVRHFFDFPSVENGEEIDAPESHKVLMFVLERLPLECMQTAFDVIMREPVRLHAEILLAVPVLEALHKETVLFDVLFRSLLLSDEGGLQSRIVERLRNETLGPHKVQVYSALAECLQRFEDLEPEKFVQSLVVVAPVLISFLRSKGNVDRLLETCGLVWRSWSLKEPEIQDIDGPGPTVAALRSGERVGAWYQVTWALLLRQEWTAAEALFFHFLPIIGKRRKNLLGVFTAISLAIALMECLTTDQDLVQAERIYRTALRYCEKLEGDQRDRLTAVCHFAWLWVMKREQYATRFAAFKTSSIEGIVDASVKRSYEDAVKALEER